MTSNQIQYQKAIAEAQERAAKTRQIQLENEMQHLENLQEKYWHYGINPVSYEDQRVVKNAFPIEAYDRGIDKARSLFGLFGDAAGVLGAGGSNFKSGRTTKGKSR